jgi:hypothetical protein
METKMTYQTQTTQQTLIDPVYTLDGPPVPSNAFQQDPTLGIPYILDNWIVESLKLTGYVTTLGIELEEVTECLDRWFGTDKMSGRVRLYISENDEILSLLKIADETMKRGLKTETKIYQTISERGSKETVRLLKDSKEETTNVVRDCFGKIKTLLGQDEKVV